MARAFFECENLVINDTQSPDLSRVNNVKDMFASAINFNSDISAWDVSVVTNMAEMFTNATLFDQNLGTWNTANVSDMTNMLSGTALSVANYDQLLLGWSVQNVQTGVRLDAGNIQFSGIAQTARDALVNDFQWTINDGGLVSPVQ